MTYADIEQFRTNEHLFAAVHGFYIMRFWWIDTFTINRGEYYRYTVNGRNGFRCDERFHWRVPSIVGQSHAFTLTPV